MSYDLDAQADAGAALAPVSAGGYGQAVTLTKGTTPVRNPDTGQISSTPQAYGGSGLEQSYRAYEIDGDRIQGGDVRFLLSPYLVAGGLIPMPAISDTLAYAASPAYPSGKTWRIMQVTPFSPAGNVVFITLQLRGA